MRLRYLLVFLLCVEAACDSTIADEHEGLNEPAIVRSEPNAALQYWMALQFVPTVFGDEWLTLRNDPYHCPLEEVNGLFTDWNRKNIVDPVHRGARIAHCDWQLPVAEHGFDFLAWHVNKTREVVSFLVGDARYRYSRSKQMQAIEELCDGINFLRHIASDASPASYHSLKFNEPKLVQTIAHFIPDLAPDSLGLLEDRLRRLQEPLSVAQRIAKQKHYVLIWLRTQLDRNADIRNVIMETGMVTGLDDETKQSFSEHLSPLNGSEIIEAASSAYDDVLRALGTPDEDFDAAIEQLTEQIRSEPIKQLFVGRHVEGLVESRMQDTFAKLRVELLNAAIAFERDGSDGFRRFSEQSEFGSLAMSKTEGGYTITSKSDNGSPQLMLRFGEGALPPAKKKRKTVYDFGGDATQTLNDAIRSAKESNKLVLLNFGANWCAPCHVLHKTLTEDEDVAAIVKQHFVLVKINVGDFSQNRDITSRYRIDLQKLGVPYLMAIDADGKPVHVDDENDSPRLPTSNTTKLKAALESAATIHAEETQRSSK